jgi:transcriptional regulator with XRE-family HTH domain
MSNVNASLIRETRVARHISGRDLAIRCRIAPQTLASIETGAKRPSVEVCYRIAGQLGLRPADILPGLPDPAEARTIRDRRRAAGLKLSELAVAAGYSDTYVSDVEHGTYRPSAALLKAVAAVLGCKPSDLDDPEDDEAEAA